MNLKIALVNTNVTVPAHEINQPEQSKADKMTLNVQGIARQPCAQVLPVWVSPVTRCSQWHCAEQEYKFTRLL